MITITTQDGPVVQFTTEEQFQLESTAIKEKVQDHLDSTARTFKFETGMDRAATYAGYTNQFQTDALVLVNWRSSIWEYLETEEAKVLAGQRTMPTVNEMMIELENQFPTPIPS